MTSRGYQDSARLVLQRWLWRYRLGYLLHPSIPAPDEHIKIADVGTGNAVWLTELCATPRLPAQSELDGFDISADHFPAKEWLPSNISLGRCDALTEIPEHLVGRYDIVHIRTFAIIVKNNNPRALLSNLIKMLRKSSIAHRIEKQCAQVCTRSLVRGPFQSSFSDTHAAGPGSYLQWDETDLTTMRPGVLQLQRLL